MDTLNIPGVPALVEGHKRDENEEQTENTITNTSSSPPKTHLIWFLASFQILPLCFVLSHLFPVGARREGRGRCRKAHHGPESVCGCGQDTGLVFV